MAALNLVFTKKAKKQTNMLHFLVLSDGTAPIGYAESYEELRSDYVGAIPLPELRGAGFVNEATGIIEFTGTAFGIELYPDRRINIAASQASLAREIAGAALMCAQANESAYRNLGGQLKQLADLDDKLTKATHRL